MKQIKLLAVLIGFCAMLVSCSDDDKGNSIERTFSGCFLRITDGGEANAFINSDAQLRLFFNLDNGTADVGILNFQPSASSNKGNITLSALPWSIGEDGSVMVNLQTIPSVSSITNLKLAFLDRSVATSYGWMSSPVVRLSFTFNDRYDVVLYQDQYLYIDNKTIVTTLEDNSTYSPDAGTHYTVTLNPTANTATLFINGAKFADNMRAVQMTFKDIPLSFVTGGYMLDATSLIPESSETPYPQYEITDLRGTAMLDSRFSLDYTCGGKWRVNTTLNYLSPRTTNGGN